MISMIKRELKLEDSIKKGKVLLLMGARRVGKTTLVDNFLTQSGEKYIKYDGTDMKVQEIFSYANIDHLSGYLDGYDILAIDEAQNIKNIGQTLKLIVDSRPNLKVIATGSSSFDLMGQVGEPLVGRKISCFLFPISVAEYIVDNKLKYEQKLPSMLIYGMYPNVLTSQNNTDKTEFLNELVNSLLLKDILTFQEVKGSDILFRLLQLLAFQLGSEVSMEELGNKLSISKNTVVRYLDLLEKAYVIFRLSGFSRNLRSEIDKKAKYYFYDNGVRNALISNFNPLASRDDVGKLWENFAIVERMKMRKYRKISANQYFWRTWSQKEIDLIEERDGQLFAYEFKYADTAKAPTEFTETYPNSKFEAINKDNFLDFVS